MSLARLSLPSISHVLETEPSIPRKRSAAAMLYNEPYSAVSVPHAHLMKTIDFRDNDLEAEEEEVFSLIVGFPKEAAVDEAQTQTIYLEQAAPAPAQLQDKKLGQALSIWVKNNFPRLVAAVRKLFPIKVAEAFVHKTGQKLVKH